MKTFNKYKMLDFNMMKRTILFLVAIGLLFTVGANPYSFNLYDINNVNGSGAATFLQLTDTPNTYVGSGGLCVKVNTTENSLSFESCGNVTSTNLTVIGDGIYTYTNQTGSTTQVNFNETKNNQTIIQIGDSLYYPLTNPDNYLNQTDADALYYSVSNPLNFINQTQTDSLYYLLTNPSNFINNSQEIDPVWNANATVNLNHVNQVCSSAVGTPIVQGTYSNGTFKCGSVTPHPTINIWETFRDDFSGSETAVGASDIWDFRSGNGMDVRIRSSGLDINMSDNRTGDFEILDGKIKAEQLYVQNGSDTFITRTRHLPSFPGVFPFMAVSGTSLSGAVPYFVIENAYIRDFDDDSTDFKGLNDDFSVSGFRFNATTGDVYLESNKGTPPTFWGNMATVYSSLQVTTDLVSDGTNTFNGELNVSGRIRQAIDVYDNAGGQTFTTGTVHLNLDTTRINTDTTFFSLANDNVTINSNGTYEVTYRVSTDISSGAARSTSKAWIAKNGVEVDGSRVYMYNRVNGNGANTGSATMLLQLTAGDVINVYVNRVGGTDTLTTIADGSGLTITQL